MPNNTEYILTQYGDDPFNHHYRDRDNFSAFTIKRQESNPNPVIRMTRENAWAQLHSSIMGPENSFLYFGPNTIAGFVLYGSNSTPIQMAKCCRQNRANTTSRYFITQTGKEYKWRYLDNGKMECVDGRTLLATWEPASDPEDESVTGRLTLRHSALAFVTELMTALLVNRFSVVQEWDPMT